VKKVISFLIKFFIFFVVWSLFDTYLIQYSWFLRFWFYPNFLLLKELLFFSTNILSKGFLLEVEVVSTNQFLLEGILIEVGKPCLGLQVMYFFSAFIISYPGYWKNKIYFILFGILLINLLNIIRIVGLSLIFLYYPEYGDFNHHFLFTFIIYTFVFSIWLVWIKYFSFKRYNK